MRAAASGSGQRTMFGEPSGSVSTESMVTTSGTCATMSPTRTTYATISTPTGAKSFLAIAPAMTRETVSRAELRPPPR